jgi:uncharacterized metal-binding protein YceD (DUF177 family)
LKLGNQYIISFAGLKEGEHNFEFDFGQEFFDEHTLLEARGGKVKAIVILNKKATMLTLDFSISGFLEIQCDRCLDYFNYPIRYQGDLVVKFGDQPSASTDEIWIIPTSEHELDLKQYFFECIGLCLPISRIHPENADDESSGCNADMLKRLNLHAAGDEENTDPRWDKLKNLLNNTNTN